MLLRFNLGGTFSRYPGLVPARGEQGNTLRLSKSWLTRHLGHGPCKEEYGCAEAWPDQLKWHVLPGEELSKVEAPPYVP
jgi:hypothetical protein